MEIFKGKRVINRHSVIVDAKPAEVFPLLCPIKEYDWIDSWKCDMIYTESGVAEDNGIFITHFPDIAANEVWVISNYEPNKSIQFVRFNPHRITRFNIYLFEDGNSKCNTIWEQVVTGLDEEGNKWVEQSKEENFTNMVILNQNLLNIYFEKLRKKS